SACDRAGMASIEHRPDKSAAITNPGNGGAKLVIDDRVLYSFGGSGPLSDIARQKNFIEAIRLGIRGPEILGWLLRPVTSEREEYEVAFLGFGGKRFELIQDRGACGIAVTPLYLVRKDPD